MTDGFVVELVVEGRSGTNWRIDEPQIVGRGSDAAVHIDLPALSRRHAELIPSPGGLSVTDLGSRNGTFVRGERIGSDPVPLRDRDRIVLAGVVELVVHDPLATPFVPAVGRLEGLWVDPQTGDVWIDAKRLDPPLSERQQRLLLHLDAAAGGVVSRAELVEVIWPDAAAEGVTDDAVTALVKRLRQRLAELESGEPLVEIVRGRGVRLRNP